MGPDQTAPATLPIYDISGPQPVLGDIPHDQVQSAIASGKYSFPAGQDVPVVSPDGVHGTVPAEKAPDALRSGYQYATPDMVSAQADQEKYGTTGQQILTGLEGAAQGIAGPLAPLAERGLGVNPEDIRKRAEVNPITHGVSEAGGFGLGAFTGASEASLLGHAGEAVAGAAGFLGEGANVGTRLAAGAAKMATEMGLYQAGDEASKAILDAPNSVGQAAANIGLSTLLGGVAGIPLTGLGIAAKAGLNSQVLRDFSDRMAFRGSNLNPNEMMEKEFNDAINTYHAMNSELSGPSGMKSQALQKLMPELTPEIEGQAQETEAKIRKAIDKMRAQPDLYPARLVNRLENDVNRFRSGAFSEEANPSVTIPGESRPFGDIGAPDIEQSRQEFGLPSDFGNTEISGKNAAQRPSLPKERHLSDIEQYKQSIGLEGNPRIPESGKSPWPERGPEAVEDFNKKAGLPSESAPSGVSAPGAAAADLGQINELNRSGINPYQAPAPKVSPRSSGEIFDAMNNLKQDLQNYSKGNYGPFSIPVHHESYDFLNATKSLGRDVRMSLENPETWGKVADLQRTINKSWTDVLPSVKDAQSKFMAKVGGEFEPSSEKFATYANQNGKATSQTIRQKMMGNFVDSAQNHFNAVDKAYEAAGVENPFQRPSMTALQESLSKPSIGAKLADTWFDKLGAYTTGNAIGGGVGGILGHATGIPEAGFAGAYLGRWTLGPVFSSLIKPIMERGANMPAFQQSAAYAKAVLSGQANLTNAAANVFASGSKTLPSHLMPDDKQIEKLDARIKDVATNQQKLLNVSGDMGNYTPDHAQALSQTAMNAVNYLNSQRPNNPKQSPLDAEIPVSKAQEAPFKRSLAIAEQPLTVLQHIKDATLVPQDIQTLKTVYPSYYDKISQELVGAMTDHISKGEPVPYRMRQSLSLFLGQPMDSTMHPQSMQAVQAIYAQAPTQNPPAPGKAKRGTAKLGDMAKNMQTAEQSREARRDG